MALSLTGLRAAKNFARAASPAGRKRDRELISHRLDLARGLSILPRIVPPAAVGRVLVDASWDNPNYWYRYAVLRAGLGVQSGDEVALLGPYQRKIAAATARALGISDVVDFQTIVKDHGRQREHAASLVRALQAPEDILQWTLPSKLPASTVYDGILKRQRSARVDLADPSLLDHVTEALCSVAAADALLDRVQPKLVVLSHAIEFRYGAIAWCALQRGIQVVVAFGNYGALRFCRLASPDDFMETVDRPYPEHIAGLDAQSRVILADRGRAYLDRRVSGKTDDIGGRYAFGTLSLGLNRAALCDALGWDERTPIVAVYASNWFDYPHSVGMTHFSDFLDWLNVTLEAAKRQTSVNWLFRAHPCDRWYGGITLADLMSDSPMAHIRLCPIDWNGADVQKSVDALVTVHGTAGVEYAVAGKPVLLADRGWYHDVGFAEHCASRDGYLRALEHMTWLTKPSSQTSDLAAIFAGIYFGLASNDGVQMGDDSEQDRLTPSLIALLKDQAQLVASQAAAVRAWWASETPHFHTWQMMHDQNSRSEPPIAR